MTENEIELINIIRNHDNPAQALDIALSLLTDFLEKRGEPQDTSSVHLQVSA